MSTSKALYDFVRPNADLLRTAIISTGISEAEVLCIFDSRFSLNHIAKPSFLITAIDSETSLDGTKESERKPSAREGCKRKLHRGRDRQRGAGAGVACGRGTRIQKWAASDRISGVEDSRDSCFTSPTSLILTRTGAARTSRGGARN